MLTHTPPGSVGGAWASHLSLQATRPRGNASPSLFLPMELNAVSPPQESGSFPVSNTVRDVRGN